MHGFHPSAKVVCVDATPLPINVAGAVTTEFSFPCGFLEEGAVYCVTSVVRVRGNDGHPGIYLAGLPVFHGDKEISWHGHRFRLANSRSACFTQRNATEIGLIASRSSSSGSE